MIWLFSRYYSFLHLKLSQQTFVLMKMCWRHLEDVFRLCLQKMSSRRLQDLLIKTNIFALVIPLQKTSSRRLGQDQYVYLGHMSSRRFQDAMPRRLQDVFKTSSRCLAETSSRHLQYFLQRCLQDVFKTYHQVKLFLLTLLRDVFNTFLRRTEKRVMYRRICLCHTLIARVIKISQALVFHYTRPLVAACRGVFRTWSNIYNGAFFLEILNGFELVTIFAKKLHHRCLNGLKIGFLLRVWNTELTLVPRLQIKLRKYSALKYVWHHFWKSKRSWWDSKQNECLCGSSDPSGSLTLWLPQYFDKSILRNFLIF